MYKYIYIYIYIYTYNYYIYISHIPPRAPVASRRRGRAVIRRARNGERRPGPGKLGLLRAPRRLRTGFWEIVFMCSKGFF